MTDQASRPPPKDQAGSEHPIETTANWGHLLSARPVLLRLLRLAWQYPRRFLAAAVCAVGAALCNLWTPHLIGLAVDQAHHLLLDGHVHDGGLRELLRLSPQLLHEIVDQAGNILIEGHTHAGDITSALPATGLLIVLACTLRGSLTGLQGYLGESLAQRVGYDLRLSFFDKLQTLSFRFHDAHHTGDLIARGMLDLEGVRAFLESAVLRVLTLSLLLGLGSWRLLAADPLLAACALSFVPFVVWRAARMGLLLRLSWQRLQVLMSDLTRVMEENLQGLRVVRAFASQAHEMEKFDHAADAALALANRRISLRMQSMSLMHLAFYLSMGLVLWVGGGRIQAGTLTVGALTEVLTFMTLLQMPVRQIGMIVNASARAASAGARLFEIVDHPGDIREAPDALPLPPGRGVLCFENVSFAYDRTPGARPILSGIGFTLRPGQTLGIVGAPGSGKSTIAQLIPRFYDVDGGTITIDGFDIRRLTLSSLRRFVSLVQQESFLFDSSIHDNVAYAEPWAETEEVVDAARLAQVHDFVDSLPTGYSTRVGERGVALSGGQRQRLSIARGVLSQPGILILDDASSAIDASTERGLREALSRHRRRRTTIVIAHRLGVVRDADEIIVLDRGRIAERGTHEELLALGGRYAALWSMQNGGSVRQSDDFDEWLPAVGGEPA